MDAREAAAGRAIVALALAMVGAALTILVAASETPMPGEAALVRAVQDLPAWAQDLSRTIRVVTGTQVVIVLTIVFGAVLFAVGQRWRAGCLGMALLALVVVQGGVKDLVDRPRPSEIHVAVKDTWTSESYPSGHVMSGTFLFGVAALQPLPAATRPRVRAAAVTVAAVAALWNVAANLYMGVHWPADVLAGLLFGAAFALAADAGARYASSRHNR